MMQFLEKTSPSKCLMRAVLPTVGSPDRIANLPATIKRHRRIAILNLKYSQINIIKGSFFKMTHNFSSQPGQSIQPCNRPTCLNHPHSQPNTQPLPPVQTNITHQTPEPVVTGMQSNCAGNSVFPLIHNSNGAGVSAQMQSLEQVRNQIPNLGLNQIQENESSQNLDAIINAGTQATASRINSVDSQLRALEEISSSLMQIQRIVDGTNRRHTRTDCNSIITRILQEQQRMMLAELSPTSQSLMRSIVEPTPLQEIFSDVPAGFNQMSTLLH